MDEKLKICDKVIPHFPAYEVIDPRKIAIDINAIFLGKHPTHTVISK